MKKINFLSILLLLIFSRTIMASDILSFDVSGLKLHMTPSEVTEISKINFLSKERCDGKPVIVLNDPLNRIFNNEGLIQTITIDDTIYELKFADTEFENQLMSASILKRLRNSNPDWTTIKDKTVSKFGKPDFDFSSENELYMVWTNDISKCSVESEKIIFSTKYKKEVRCTGQSLHIFNNNQPMQLQFVLSDAELIAKSLEIRNKVNEQCAKDEAENLDF